MVPGYAVLKASPIRFATSLFIQLRLSVKMAVETNKNPRGAFIVLEGLDRAGKTTQASMLIQALKDRSIPVEKRVFPNRNTAVGAIINDYLAKKIELAPEAVHLLYSANRWECRDDIRKALESGTTLVVDRYAASGAAYSAANTGRPLSWCKLPDEGLPAPDLVLYLEVSEEVQASRADWGAERFERHDFQRAVGRNFKDLADPATWQFIPSSGLKEDVHRDVLDKALAVVDACKLRPIGALYG